MPIKQMWVRDSDGNVLAVFGQIKMESKIIGDQIMMSISYPVLYRHNLPNKQNKAKLESNAALKDTEPTN